MFARIICTLFDIYLRCCTCVRSHKWCILFLFSRPIGPSSLVSEPVKHFPTLPPAGDGICFLRHDTAAM
jgi:hypothetical protein